MSLIAYTVTARLPDLATRERFVAWLAGGHVAEVCGYGALSGQIVVLDQPQGEPPVVEVRYLFPDRATLDRYFSEYAPRLRAEGLARFGPESGVQFSRSTGVISHQQGSR
ncbi:MAG: DUF4286 family protein [Phycisphaerales bacterium]